MSKPYQRKAGIIGAMILSGCLLSSAAVASDAIAQGKKIAFDRKKGNCLGCHQIEGGTLAGNIAPPLIAMKARFPDKAKLRAQIYDATKNNPHSVMPPFGKHGALSDKEIDLITEFVHSL
jgi:sulfur-oxidizing protein SoxX